VEARSLSETIRAASSAFVAIVLKNKAWAQVRQGRAGYLTGRLKDSTKGICRGKETQCWLPKALT
jgi:hypothetical protein